MGEYGKIGVWQTAFLGDAVLTLPLLENLALAYPGAEIDFWIRSGLGPLFSAVPYISNVREFDKRGRQKGPASALSLGREIAGMKYDLWISAHTSFRSGVIARASKIPLRIGYDKPWYNRLFYHRVVDRAFNRLEEIERLLQLLRPLNIRPTVDRPRLVLPEDSTARAEEFFAARVRGPVLGIHPGSVWPTKRWPAEYFSRIIETAANQGIQVVIFAGPGETGLAEEIIQDANIPADSNAVFNLAGKLSLPDLAAYIAKVSCYLSNDSGPMHLAWTQGVPLAAVFGPTVRSLGFYPRGEDSTVLEMDLDCRPCGLHGSRKCPRGDHRCMTGITPDMVWETIRSKIR